MRSYNLAIQHPMCEEMLNYIFPSNINVDLWYKPTYPIELYHINQQLLFWQLYAIKTDWPKNIFMMGFDTFEIVMNLSYLTWYNFIDVYCVLSMHGVTFIPDTRQLLTNFLQLRMSSPSLYKNSKNSQAIRHRLRYVRVLVL